MMTLQRRLYRLQDVSKIWFNLITKKVGVGGLQQSISALCVLWRDGVILVCYVDDLLVSVNTDKDVLRLQDQFRKELIMKAVDNPMSFYDSDLGRHEDAVYLSQKGVINNLQENSDLTESNSMKTPMNNNQDRVDDDQLWLCYEEA